MMETSIEYCRLCLKEAPRKYRLFDELCIEAEIGARAFLNLIGLKTNEDSNLPGAVCFSCDAVIKLALDFKERCEESERVLQTKKGCKKYRPRCKARRRKRIIKTDLKDEFASDNTRPIKVDAIDIKTEEPKLDITLISTTMNEVKTEVHDIRNNHEMKECDVCKISYTDVTKHIKSKMHHAARLAGEKQKAQVKIKYQRIIMCTTCYKTFSSCGLLQEHQLKSCSEDSKEAVQKIVVKEELHDICKESQVNKAISKRKGIVPLKWTNTRDDIPLVKDVLVTKHIQTTKSKIESLIDTNFSEKICDKQKNAPPASMKLEISVPILKLELPSVKDECKSPVFTETIGEPGEMILTDTDLLDHICITEVNQQQDSKDEDKCSKVTVFIDTSTAITDPQEKLSEAIVYIKPLEPDLMEVDDNDLPSECPGNKVTLEEIQVESDVSMDSCKTEATPTTTSTAGEKSVDMTNTKIQSGDNPTPTKTLTTEGKSIGMTSTKIQSGDNPTPTKFPATEEKSIGMTSTKIQSCDNPTPTKSSAAEEKSVGMTSTKIQSGDNPTPTKTVTAGENSIDMTKIQSGDNPTHVPTKDDSKESNVRKRIHSPESKNLQNSEEGNNVKKMIHTPENKKSHPIIPVQTPRKTPPKLTKSKTEYMNTSPHRNRNRKRDSETSRNSQEWKTKNNSGNSYNSWNSKGNNNQNSVNSRQNQGKSSYSSSKYNHYSKNLFDLTDNSYECSFCFKSFRTYMELDRHINVHIIVCRYCGKMVSRSDIQKHNRSNCRDDAIQDLRDVTVNCWLT